MRAGYINRLQRLERDRPALPRPTHYCGLALDTASYDELTALEVVSRTMADADEVGFDLAIERCENIERFRAALRFVRDVGGTLSDEQIALISING